MLRRLSLWLVVGGLAAFLTGAGALAQDEKAPAAGANRPDAARRGARGQQDATAKADQNQGPGAGRQGPGGGNNPFAAFNDPAERLRRLRNEISTRPRNLNNGQGGPGGMMMMGGGGMSTGIWGLLLRSQPLQDEIGMTPEQKQQLQEISTNAREKMRDIGRQAFQGFGRGQGGQGQNGGGRGQFNIDPQQMEAMQADFAAMREENEAAIQRVMKKNQFKRLNEIRLRILGGTFAVAETDVAEALMLTPEQNERIMEIMAQYDQATMTMMQDQFRGMGGMFGRGRGGEQGGGAAGQRGQQGPGAARAPGTGAAGAPGAARGQANQGEDGDDEEAPARPANRGRTRPADEGDDDGDEPAANQRGNRQRNGDETGDRGENEGGGGGPGGRRGFQMTDEQRAEMEKNIAEMRKKTDDLEKQVEAEVRKVLTPGNRSKFNKLLGEDYDLTKLVAVQERGPGGRGRDAENGNPQGNARRAPGGQPRGETAPAEKGEDSKDEAPAQPRSRPAPRVRGGSN